MFTLLVTILFPGIADYGLAALGYSTLSGVVWMSGYGFGIIAIWYIWIRLLSLHGPSGAQSSAEDDPQSNGDSSLEQNTLPP